MNNKSEYGKIFKQLCLEWGLRPKEVTGDIISTKTLRCFEADETSILLVVFEKLILRWGERGM